MLRSCFAFYFSSLSLFIVISLLSSFLSHFRPVNFGFRVNFSVFLHRCRFFISGKKLISLLAQRWVCECAQFLFRCKSNAIDRGECFRFVFSFQNSWNSRSLENVSATICAQRANQANKWIWNAHWTKAEAILWLPPVLIKRNKSPRSP